jgi:type IV secretory pathway VirB3-like protein
MLKAFVKSLENQSEIEKIERSLMFQKNINHPKKIATLLVVISILLGVVGKILIGGWTALIIIVVIFLFGYLMIKDKHNFYFWSMGFLCPIICFSSYFVTQAISDRDAKISEIIITICFMLALCILFTISLYLTVEAVIKEKTISRKMIFVFENGEILHVNLLSITQKKDYIVNILHSESELVNFPADLKSNEKLEVFINKSKIQKIVCLK